MIDPVPSGLEAALDRELPIAGAVLPRGGVYLAARALHSACPAIDAGHVLEAVGIRLRERRAARGTGSRGRESPS